MSKRIKISLTTFALLISAWLIWARIAHNRLKSEIDAIAALHEPIYTSDLDFSPVPDNENAAYYYKSAFNAISGTVFCPSEGNVTFPTYPPFPPAWHQAADQAAAANAQLLALARKASEFDRADWGERNGSPLFDQLRFAYFNPCRSIANNLGDAALVSHFENDDAEAFRRVSDLFHLVKAVEQRGFLHGRLVSIGIESLVIDRIKIIALDLHVKNQSQSPHGVERADILKLISQLFESGHDTKRRLNILMAERVIILDESLYASSSATVLRPMIQLDAARFLSKNRQFLLAGEQANWAAAQTILGFVPSFPSGNRSSSLDPPRFSRFLELIDERLPPPDYLFIEFEMASEEEIAAISLAANLYHLDHGHWPINLQSLVGEYLPAVPENPFSSSHKPIDYMLTTAPNGVVRPLLYFDRSDRPLNTQPPSTPTLGEQSGVSLNNREWRDISNWWMIAPTTLPSKN